MEARAVHGGDESKWNEKKWDAEAVLASDSNGICQGFKLLRNEKYQDDQGSVTRGSLAGDMHDHTLHSVRYWKMIHG